MNLYFRLLKLILSRLLFRKPLKLLDTSIVTGQVWPTDLDNNIHMNNGRYLTIMDLGRFDWLLSCGFLKVCLKNRWFPIVGALKIIYIKPLNPFQKFELKTRILGWDAKWIYVEQIFEVNGAVCSKSVLQGLFHGPQGKVSTQEWLKTIGFTQKSPKLPADVRAWLRSSK
ncbi:MAG TPA: thioesterase family protein [bacterium]|nr:thioesterase family protein [bacterium]